MPFKTSYDNPDDIPETHREHYVESKTKEGKPIYVIGLEGTLDYVPQAKSIKDEAARYRTQKDDFEKKYGSLKVFEGMDHAEVAAKLARIEELEAAAGGKIDEKKINEIVENRLKGKVAPIERDLNTVRTQAEALKKENEDLKNEKRTRKITDMVREAATTLKMLPEALDDAIVLGERILTVTDDGVVETKDGVGVTPGLSPKSWLEELQEKKPHWWGTTAGGGSTGNRGGSGLPGVNPFTAENWNMTEQGNMLKTDRAKAERYAKAAGTSIGGPKPAPKQK